MVAKHVPLAKWTVVPVLQCIGVVMVPVITAKRAPRVQPIVGIAPIVGTAPATTAKRAAIVPVIAVLARIVVMEHAIVGKIVGIVGMIVGYAHLHQIPNVPK